jgi:sugar phosphate isomerase/epimerase
MDRRHFLTTGAVMAASAGGAASAPAMAQCDPPFQKLVSYPQQQQFRIGYTTNTRGGWEGNPFKGIREGREVGFRYFEIFGTSFCAVPKGPMKGLSTNRGAPPADAPLKKWSDGYVYVPASDRDPHIVYYPDNWEALQHRMYEIGAQFTAITGGAAGEPNDFADPALRDAVVKNHFNMARFSRRFGCDHQKTNTGARRAGGSTIEDLKNICRTLDQTGKRIREELGMTFGPHPHLGSQIQTRQELDYIMEHTNPGYVGLVLDTGHFSMAGMDPLAMAKKYASRVIEYHLKDVKKEDRGGTKNVPTPARNQMNDPYFYPLGEGGVDFPALIAFLKDTKWRGHLTVELDASPWRPPKESARITANYIRSTLKIEL